MPILDGVNAVRIMKKIKPGIAVIAFSGNARQEGFDEILHAGAKKCMVKPFEMQELKLLLRSAEGPV